MNARVQLTYIWILIVFESLHIEHSTICVSPQAHVGAYKAIICINHV